VVQSVLRKDFVTILKFGERKASHDEVPVWRRTGGIRISPIVSDRVRTYTTPDNPHEKINDDGSRTVWTITKMKLCLNRRFRMTSKHP